MCWDEFEAAAKRLSFKGDVPGAWRFFDQETFPGSQVPDRDACGMRDASGCLNLHEWQDISGSISFRLGPGVIDIACCLCNPNWSAADREVECD